MRYFFNFSLFAKKLTFFVSLKQRIWNVSKFGSDKISLNVIQITNIKWLNDCKFCTICFKVNNCYFFTENLFEINAIFF